MLLSKIASHLKSALWFIPLVWAVAAIGLNVLTIGIDRAYDHQLLPPEWIGSADAALAILGTVAASMISLIATVLAITMVVVQLAMQQFSPRIVQTFLQDRPSQMAIGIFVATFVQSILSMREVVIADEETVPGLSIAVTFVLVVIDTVVLVVYIHHIGRSLRVSALIEMVGEDTRKLLDEIYPQPPALEDPDLTLVRARKSGVLTKVGYDQLVAEAERVDVRIELVPALGEFVPAGGPLAHIHGGQAADLELRKVHGALVLGLERTLDQDVAFGLRMLVDMGLKALADSPLSDPTTTVQSLDRIHDVLFQLARREFPDGRREGADGTVRLVVPTMDWAAYVSLSYDELRMAGAASPQVSRRLRASLLDLKQIAGSERQAPLDAQLEKLTSRIEDETSDDRDVAMALAPDRQGLGVAAGSGRLRD